MFLHQNSYSSVFFFGFLNVRSIGINKDILIQIARILTSYAHKNVLEFIDLASSSFFLNGRDFTS